MCNSEFLKISFIFTEVYISCITKFKSKSYSYEINYKYLLLLQNSWGFKSFDEYTFNYLDILTFTGLRTRTNNDPPITIQKTKDRATRTPLKTRG
jgi:hypothetical protein